MLPRHAVATLEFDLEIYEAVASRTVEVRQGLPMETDVANHAVAVLNDPVTGSPRPRG
jgi:hypothetical protein